MTRRGSFKRLSNSSVVVVFCFRLGIFGWSLSRWWMKLPFAGERIKTTRINWSSFELFPSLFLTKVRPSEWTRRCASKITTRRKTFFAATKRKGKKQRIGMPCRHCFESCGTSQGSPLGLGCCGIQRGFGLWNNWRVCCIENKSGASFVNSTWINVKIIKEGKKNSLQAFFP